ncbi:MAG: hypothetical protein Q4F05_14625 [bacterium]|nr:hypothetical protein [bacterium]
MQGRYLPAVVTLIAGLVASIICLVKKISIIKSLTIVLVVLIIFLILGLIARKVIVYTLNEKTVVSEKDDSETDTNENPEHENDTEES